LLKRIERVLVRKVLKTLEDEARKDPATYKEKFFKEFGYFLKEGEKKGKGEGGRVGGSRGKGDWEKGGRGVIVVVLPLSISKATLHFQAIASHRLLFVTHFSLLLPLLSFPPSRRHLPRL
jgi:hypothetical protein